MRTRQVVALVIGILLLLPGLGLVFGGGAIGVAELAARDEGGWHSMTIDQLSSSGVAVTSEGAVFRLERTPGQLRELDLQFRLTVTPTDPAQRVFVGVAPAADLATYLQGAAHDEVTSLSWGGFPTYRSTPGTDRVPPPAVQQFWVARATGAGTQELTWTARSGEWSVAVLNASGTSGVSVSAVGAARSGALLPASIGIFVVGLVLLALGSVLIVTALRRPAEPPPGAYGQPVGYPAPAPAQPAYAEAAPGEPGSPYAAGAVMPWRAVPTQERPVVLEARIAPNLSRGLWLVKWFLAIPHFVILCALWVVFGVATVGAWFAILFTGRYPRSLFHFNVGVLRWSWRVMHYCGTGGLGTDRYPPFTLDPMPDDDARLDIAYPDHLSRGLIFVKWILLLPHWIIVALIVGTQSRTDENGVQVGGWPGVLGILVFVAGLVLLFGGTLPRGIFDVVVGLNRWVYRVTAYGALMTDVYPPFRYDGGGEEPVPGWKPPSGPPVAGEVPREVAPPQPVPPDAVPPDAVPPDAGQPSPAPQNESTPRHPTPSG